MTTLIVCIAAGVGVAALVGGVAVMLRADVDTTAEDRLDALTGVSGTGMSKDALNDSAVLAKGLGDTQTIFDDIMSRLGKVGLLFEQADSNLTAGKFFAISGGLALAAGVGAVMAQVHAAVVPVIAICAAFLPLMWILHRKKRRLKRFSAQLPDALELIARALRAGHSLGAGFQLVADEMPDPICVEFGRVFEEQNLGIPFDDALNSLTDRIPNLDLRFFATSIILQRQTGGDLAEILDKIGHLIRERFKIWGQVQALTGEGRLSGIVLLALPPFLFVAVYRLNPSYIKVLFTDPLGKKMLIGGLLMQLLGAVVIRKIVNIKV